MKQKQKITRYHQIKFNNQSVEFQKPHHNDVQSIMTIRSPQVNNKGFKSRFIQSTSKTMYKSIEWFQSKQRAIERINQQSSRAKSKIVRYGVSQKKPKRNIDKQQNNPQEKEFQLKTQYRLNKIVQHQLNNPQNNINKNYLVQSSYDIKNLLNDFLLNKHHPNISSQKKNLIQSPYSAYCVNAFPKKQVKISNQKNKLYPLKGQSNNYQKDQKKEGVEFRKSLIQKIREMTKDSKLEQENKNILQVMTIFSIKQNHNQRQLEQQLAKQKKRNHMNKSINQSVLSNSQQHQLLDQKLATNVSKLYKRKQPKNEEQLNNQAQSDTIYTKKINSYMLFLVKVNYSNNIFIRNVDFSDKYSNQKVKVFVGEGNNKYLIIGLLKRRFWIEITNKITHQTKFIWTQNTIKEIHNVQTIHKLKDAKRVDSLASEKPSQMLLAQSSNNSFKLTSMPKIRFNTLLNSQQKPKQQQEVAQFKQKIKKLNQFQYSSQALLSVPADNKNQRVLDTPTQTKKNIESDKKISIFKVKSKKPIKKQSNYKLFIDENKSQRANKFLSHFKFNLKKQLQISPGQYYENLQILTNHVPRNSFIGSKKALFYTMEHYYRKVKKVDPFEYIPKTYHFKDGPTDQSFKRFLENEKKVNQKSIWIVKPGQCTNRGKGISIMRASQITRKILKKQKHPNGQWKTLIVQSYITKPLLYNHRKFDIRHYMLVTIINGNLKAYWYADGYLRTSCQIFNLQKLEDPYIHLTNDAIQITSSTYGKYQPGNKLSYNELQRYLDNHYPKNRINFREQILPKMRDIATDIVKANYKNLDKERRMNNFQIFGLDFMLDYQFKPWLIEVNANPCLELNCPLLTRIIPIMVQHALRLGLDPLIMPTCHYPPIKRYFLSDNFIDKLKFQIIFDELFYKDQSQFDGSLNYDFEFDQPEDEYQNNGVEIDLAKLLD